jgi:hypothetical protein
MEDRLLQNSALLSIRPCKVNYMFLLPFLVTFLEDEKNYFVLGTKLIGFEL